MRNSLMIFSLFSTLVLAQSFELAPIMPEDLGAYKWVMKTTPGAGELAVFRVETTETGANGVLRSREIRDSVVCPIRPDREQSETAFFFNPRYFDSPRSSTWHFSIPGSSGSITGKVQEYTLGPTKAEIVFRDSGLGTTRMVFTVFNIAYKKAKDLHPNLPEMKELEGWTWVGYLEETNE